MNPYNLLIDGIVLVLLLIGMVKIFDAIKRAFNGDRIDAGRIERESE